MLRRLKQLVALCMVATVAAMAIGAPASAQEATTTITLLHFSDYHSHAIPFYSEGANNQAGIARTIAYIKAQRQANRNLLVLSGGDMLNKGSPTWSDEYKCIEWPWFNGLVDAMALGNHEFDYGQDVFKGCQASANYPTLSANYVGGDGNPLLLADGKPYLVKEVGGVKIGLFALAGSDFSTLIAKANRPADSSFADRIDTAKKIVSTLRDTEKVDAVVLFGHASREDDIALAQAVPGIDLILGTHSHYKGEFMKVPNSNTYYISPFQYLTYLSNVQLTFTGSKLTGATGKLVKMDATQPEDPAIATQVAQLQKDLEAKYPDRFKVLGKAAVELSAENIDTDESVLGNWSMEVVRASAGVNAFFSTSSSFRASIPPGPITVETFFTAIPYKNSIVTADMTGQQLSDLINLIVSKRGSDNFCQESGVRFKMQDGKATDIQVLVDPANPTAGFAALDPAKTYKVGATNFMTGVSAVYKGLFAQAANLKDTQVDIGTLLTDKIRADGTITGALDGRMGTAVHAAPTATAAVSPTAETTALPATAVPAATTAVVPTPSSGQTPGMPTTGGESPLSILAIMFAASILLLAGFAVKAFYRRSVRE